MINNLVRKSSKLAGKFFSAGKLINAELPVFLPFYHVVSNRNLPYILNYHVRNTKEFEKELDFYLKYFQPISLNDLKSANINGKAFHLSFDDGLKECSEIVAPVLLKKGIPATFFINSAFIDNKEMFHRYKAGLIFKSLKQKANNRAVEFLDSNGISIDNILQTSFMKTMILDQAALLLGIDFSRFLDEQKPYLTTDQVLELHKNGFTVGAHSHRHPEFWLIEESLQKEEIRLSIDWLNKTIKPEIKAFAFPFTDSGVSENVFEYLYNLAGCDISFGTAGIKYDTFSKHLQRFPVEKPGNFENNLKAEIIYHFLRKPFGKTIVKH